MLIIMKLLIPPLGVVASVAAFSPDRQMSPLSVLSELFVLFHSSKNEM